MYFIADCDLDGTTVNAAFAIQVMEPQKEIEECIAIARESLDSGRALATLKKFIEINK